MQLRASKKDYSDRRRMPAVARNFVLRAIAQYKSDGWIVQKLKERWNLERSPFTIAQLYRYSPQHRARIQQYRDEYNSREHEEALASKRHVLQYLHEAVELAMASRDFRGVAALMRQVIDVGGHRRSSDLEVATSVGRSYEDTLREILDSSKAI